MPTFDEELKELINEDPLDLAKIRALFNKYPDAEYKSSVTDHNGKSLLEILFDPKEEFYKLSDLKDIIHLYHKKRNNRSA